MAKTVFEGTIGQIYELRYTAEKRAVIDFSVAEGTRVKDGNSYRDGATNWHNCTAWGKRAENIAASLRPGDRVLVEGTETMKEAYTNKEGKEYPARPQVVVDNIGISLTFDTAKSDRVAKGNSAPRSNGSNANAGASSAPAPAAASNDFDLDNYADDTPF